MARKILIICVCIGSVGFIVNLMAILIAITYFSPPYFIEWMFYPMPIVIGLIAIGVLGNIWLLLLEEGVFK